MDPFGVLGLAPDASLKDVRAARLALAKQLHPDLHGIQRSQARTLAERRLAEVNAAYDAIIDRWSREAMDAPRLGHEATTPADPGPVATLVVGASRPVAFEALVVAAGDVGDVTDADEPFSLVLHVEGPPTGFCRLELMGEKATTVVTLDSEAVDPVHVADVLARALRRLDVTARIIDGSAR